MKADKLRVRFHADDLEMQRALARMSRAFDGLIAIQERAIVMPLPSKMPLAVDMSSALQPVLADLYWHPLRNGLDAAPQAEAELRTWLKHQFSMVTAVAALLALLLLFHKRAVNVGGSIALELLKLSGTFNLTNAEYIKLIEARGAMLTTAGSEMSLIDTTVNDLSSAIPQARNATGDTLTLLGAYIAGRALTRSVGIGSYEVPWGFNRGLNWTYKENGVARLMYDVNGIGCEEICEPLDGITFPIDDMPSGLGIPQHPGCDCIYSPADDGWIAPDDIWRGE